MRHPDFLPTGKPTVGERTDLGVREPARAFSEDERLGIGVLGLHEGHTMLVALRASQFCKAVAGCDLEKAKRDEALEAAPGISVTDDYDAMLARKDVDIVAIYTPDPMHAEHIERAFHAGKHVICTKPLINDLSQGEKLLKVAKETGMRLQVGQSTRFYEPFLRQRELFEAGQLGEIEVFDAHYNHRMDWWYEKSPWAIEGTHWAYLGLSHPVDLARWYLGPIREVHAYGSVSSLGKKVGMKTPDAIVVNLISQTGKIGRILGNYGIHELPAARSLIECFLMGSKGSSLARYPDLRFTYSDERGVQIDEDYEHAMAGYYYRHELKGMHYGEFCNIADYFATCILSGKPNSPDLVEGLETVAVMDAIVRSLKSGEPEKPK
jgi:predicted dehydrogenase